jgi:hypothetical protein
MRICIAIRDGVLEKVIADSTDLIVFSISHDCEKSVWQAAARVDTVSPETFFQTVEEENI